MKTIILSLLILIGLNSCGKKETSKSENEIIKLAVMAVEVIVKIEDAENEYANYKNRTDWKNYYNIKLEKVNLELDKLNKIIQEVKFFERMPDEKTVELAKNLSAQCENIKLYITTTNIDLTKYFAKAPPAYDPYNWDRLIIPTVKNLKLIIEKNNLLVDSLKFKGSRYFLHDASGEVVNKQIQSSPHQMEGWKQDVESAIDKLPEGKIKK